MIYKSKGFSLVEVLMTLLIMSLILVLAVPIVTRNLSFRESDGVVFTYTTKEQNVKCPTSDISSADGSCSRYEFTVPNGVHYVNLTLVAGGGGGGGAAGMAYKRNFIGPQEYSASGSYNKYILSDIQSLKISNLSARGADVNFESQDSIQDLTNCQTNGDIITTGTGARSSAAIVDYDIPSYFYQSYKDNSNNPLLEYIIHDKYVSYDNRNQRALYFVRSSSDNYYKEKFCTGTEENKTICRNNFNIQKHYFVDLNRGIQNNIADIQTLVRYGVGNVGSNIGEVQSDTAGNLKLHNENNGYCYSNSTTDNDIVNSTRYCFKRHKGGQQQKEINKTTMEADYCSGKTGDVYVLGGGGGTINDTLTRGQGVSGCYYRIQCSDVSKSNMSKSSSPNNEGASFEILTKSWIYNSNLIDKEDLRLTGGGGSGGNAIRITGFKVEPNETYVIYVGKGGKGGAAGKDHETTAYIGSSVDPSAGISGENGTATIISRKNGNNENRLFVVLGGAGGKSGAKESDGGKSEQTNAGFFNLTGNEVNIDQNLVTLVGNTTIGNNIIRVYYNFLQEQNAPYWALNYSNSSEKSGVPTSYQPNQSYLKGFSDFNHPTSGSGHLQSKNNVVVEGEINNADHIYDGFYYRTFLKNYTIGYVGGLGGFSGLGGKAGCGGLFMGNSFGAITNSDATEYSFNELYKNKFVVTVRNEDDATENRAFNVNDYYDNCTNDASDGGTAVFVMPNPKDKTFGQAGAGGGGGGYSIEYGPGSGGDGQNGYLMIDWRK